MKYEPKLFILTIAIVLLCGATVYGQRMDMAKSNLSHKTIVVKKHNRWVRRVVYHPYWAPTQNYYHRWIYFPHYNFYWDNEKCVFVYKSGLKWIVASALPEEYSNANLKKSKSVELVDVDDSSDEVFSKNSEHQKTYGADG
ncbi:MAG: hypothetical protein AB7S48_12390 [Bacteroidales bacterium]